MEDKKLLLEIANLHASEINLRMKDNLSWDDRKNLNDIYKKIDELEKQYKENYGALPEWETPEDVQNAINELSREVQL